MFAPSCTVSIRRNFISIQLALVLFLSLLLTSTYAEEPGDAKGLIREWKRLPQWKHLDESIVDVLPQVPRGGPRISYTVQVVTPDQKPVKKALVVLFESSSELINSVYKMNDRSDNRFLAIPLDLSVTDDQGQSIRTDVRTRSVADADLNGYPSEKPKMSRMCG